MKESFHVAKKRERLPVHLRFINSIDCRYLAVPATRHNWKLHDAECLVTGNWFESKTDDSGYVNRYLVEYKANVDPDLLRGIPRREEIRRPELRERLQALPEKYNALATDCENLEPSHLLSYLWSNTGQIHLLDIRALRAQIAASRYPFFVCGEPTENWRTVAVLVPTEDVQPLAVKRR